MPSPKNLATALANDPIYQAMMRGNIKWGNIAMNVTRKNKSCLLYTSDAADE